VALLNQSDVTSLKHGQPFHRLIFHSQSPPPMTGLPLKYYLRWNLLQPVGIKEKHVNNDWMLLILVTVNPLDGLRSAVTKKAAQILTQSDFELLHA